MSGKEFENEEDLDTKRPLPHGDHLITNKPEKDGRIATQELKQIFLPDNSSEVSRPKVEYFYSVHTVAKDPDKLVNDLKTVETLEGLKLIFLNNDLYTSNGRGDVAVFDSHVAIREIVMLQAFVRKNAVRLAMEKEVEELPLHRTMIKRRNILDAMDDVVDNCETPDDLKMYGLNFIVKLQYQLYYNQLVTPRQDTSIAVGQHLFDGVRAYNIPKAIYLEENRYKAGETHSTMNFISVVNLVIDLIRSDAVTFVTGQNPYKKAEVQHPYAEFYPVRSDRTRPTRHRSLH